GRIFTGMIAGAGLGLAANVVCDRLDRSADLEAFITGVTQPAGQIFLRLIFMVVIPLIVAALMLGVAELGDVRRLGRVGAKTLAFTIVLSSLSVLIGVGLANLLRPGAGLGADDRALLLEAMRKSSGAVKAPPVPKSGMRILVDLIPENPV